MWEYIVLIGVLALVFAFVYDFGRQNQQTASQREMNKDHLIRLDGHILDYSNANKVAMIYLGTECLWTVKLDFISNEVKMTRNSGKSGAPIHSSEAKLLAEALNLVSYEVKEFGRP